MTRRKKTAAPVDPYTTVIPRTSLTHADQTFCATLAQTHVYGQGEAVNAAKAWMLPYLIGVARRHSGGDGGCAEDLFQETRRSTAR